MNQDRMDAPAVAAGSGRISTATMRRRYATAALTVGVAAVAGGGMLATAPGSTLGRSTVAVSAGPAALELGSPLLDPAAAARRADRASRSQERRQAPEVVATRYTTVDLKVRRDPAEDAAVVTVLPTGSKVRITDERDGQWQQILHKGRARWVAAEFLAKKKPAAPTEAAISAAACASGSGVESGLNRNAVAVHRAVCNRYPQITAYGGVGGGGYHASGRALDIMVRGSLGDDVAGWLRSNASRLGIMEIIWEQRIWTRQRSGDGWRWMSDRGSATANHYDHVHVSVY